MTGHEVKAIRKALGWTARQLGEVLAVHPVTVYRWEAEAKRQIKAEGLAGRVLGWMHAAIGAYNKEHLIEQIQKRVRVEGPIAAFAYIAGFGYGDTIHFPGKLS